MLDFNVEPHEKLISVDKGLVKNLKPHQLQGVKFMWDACFESCENIGTSTGGGCILAHCMGLGKSINEKKRNKESCQETLSRLS